MSISRISQFQARNNRPAFGCAKCDLARMALLNTGTKPQEVDAALTRLLKLASITTPRGATHDTIARKLLRILQDILTKKT